MRTKYPDMENCIKAENVRADYNKRMYSKAKKLAFDLGVDPKVIIAKKDHVHYRGRGWDIDKNSNPIHPGKTEFRDRISETCKKFMDILVTNGILNTMDDLKVYLDEFHKQGVDISFNKDFIWTNLYGFKKNKGYGSKAHMEAIREHGPCPIHRRSFDPLRTWLTENTLF